MRSKRFYAYSPSFHWATGRPQDARTRDAEKQSWGESTKLLSAYTVPSGDGMVWRGRVRLPRDLALRVRTRPDDLTRTIVAILLERDVTAPPGMHCGHEHDCCGCYVYSSVAVRPARRTREFFVEQSVSRNI
jgi:hypothetical protein